MVYNGISKGTKDLVVNQMVEDVTMALETVADKSWVPWVDCLIPNVAHQVQAEVEAKVHEQHECKPCTHLDFQ